MARIQFPHTSSALTASFSVRQQPNAPFVLSCPPAAPRLPCGCRRRCKGFPSASSWPRPSGDRSALSGSRKSLPSQSPSLWQAPFGQGLSPFPSHRTDGLFLRKMSVSRSPCSSPCFQFPRSQCLLQYLAEQFKQPACNLPRLTPSVLALFPVCQVRLLHVKELCPGTVDSQSAAQLKGSGCCCSAVPAVSDSSVPCTSSGTSGQLNLIVFQDIQRLPAKFFSRLRIIESKRFCDLFEFKRIYRRF